MTRKICQLSFPFKVHEHYTRQLLCLCGEEGSHLPGTGLIDGLCGGGGIRDGGIGDGGGGGIGDDGSGGGGGYGGGGGSSSGSSSTGSGSGDGSSGCGDGFQELRSSPS